MAPKKKADLPDVEKAKGKISASARTVGKAAENLLRKPVTVDEWGRTVNEVDAMDRAFGEEEVAQKESFMDFLRNKMRNGETEVRVLQIGPEGRLVDVSDKVKPQDLRPEDISSIRTEDGKTLPLGRNPQSREAAYRALQQMLPGLKEQSSGKSESIRRMELVLEESDKILEHWKK